MSSQQNTYTSVRPGGRDALFNFNFFSDDLVWSCWWTIKDLDPLVILLPFCEHCPLAGVLEAALIPGWFHCCYLHCCYSMLTSVWFEIVKAQHR